MPILAALPYLGTAGLAALRFAPTVSRFVAGRVPQLIKPTTGIRKTGTAVVPYTGGGLPAVIGGGARVGSGSVPSAGGGGVGSAFAGNIPSLPKGTLLATGTSLAGYKLAGDLLGDAQISANGGISDEQRKREAEDEQTGVPRKDKDDETKKTVDDINKGDLDDYITKNISLFEKFLGDRKGETKAAGFQALTEFGLNLATARGGNLIDKIARSAKDPLQTFAAIGKAARDRADKIKMAAIETGIQQREAALDRAEKDKPDDIQTLEYFLSIPELRNKPIEELIRLSKSKATMSDDDFRKELILAFAPNIQQIGGPEKVEELVRGIMALGTGTSGGTTGGLSMQEQVDLAKEKGASNEDIRKQLIALGEDPADYGF